MDKVRKVPSGSCALFSGMPIGSFCRKCSVSAGIRQREHFMYLRIRGPPEISEQEETDKFQKSKEAEDGKKKSIQNRI